MNTTNKLNGHMGGGDRKFACYTNILIIHEQCADWRATRKKPQSTQTISTVYYNAYTIKQPNYYITIRLTLYPLPRDPKI